MRFLGSEPTPTDLPAAALMILIIAALNYDTESVHRGWGQQYLGEGVTVDGTHYSTSEARMVDASGQAVMGVTLTVRPHFWVNSPSKAYDSHTYPLSELRRIVAELPLAVTE
jgi:hypothetical protein